MKYEKFLNNLKKCPFCNLNKNQILKSNKNALLILARAPYTKDHLIVIPKRHVLLLNKLKKPEKINLAKLLFYAMRKLHKKSKNISLIYREGIKEQVGKSIDHLHIHIIPNTRLSSTISKNKAKRNLYSDKKYDEEIRKIKRLIN